MSLKAVLLTFLAVAISLSSAIAKEKMTLDTEKKKISYAVGRNIAESIMSSGIDIDIDVFTATIVETICCRNEGFQNPVLHRQQSCKLDAGFQPRGLRLPMSFLDAPLSLHFARG